MDSLAAVVLILASIGISLPLTRFALDAFLHVARLQSARSSVTDPPAQ